METYLTQVADYLVRQSWQIAVLVVIVAAATFALRNKSAHVRYLLWLIVLAKCLAPPLLEVPVAVLPEKAPAPAFMPNPIPRTEAPADTPRQLKPLPGIKPVAASRPQLNTRQWLAIGWMIGAAALAGIAAVKAGRTVRWLHRDRKPLPEDVQKGVNSLLSSLNLRKLPKMWLIEGIGQPFVWGIFRGDIYLPASFVRIPDDEHRRHVLGHELSHVMRFDAAVNLIQTIAQAILWFHPFVWWTNKKIRAEREKCCDEMAIARLNARAKDYSRSIVETLVNEYESTRPVPSLAVAGPVKTIEERIKTVMKPGRRFHKRPSLITLTFVLLLALTTVPTAFVLIARAEDKPSIQKEDTEEYVVTETEARMIKQARKRISQGGVDLNEGDNWGYTPLHWACMNGYKELARLLIDNGADINSKNIIGLTPLHIAAGRGHAHVVTLLVANNADINARDNQSATPLWYAKNGVVFSFSSLGKLNKKAKSIWNPDNPGCKEATELLQEHGAIEQAPIVTLHEAARDGLVEQAKSLIAKGADVNAMDDRLAATPLHLAVYFANTDMVKLLIANGADVNAKNKWNRTPLHIAIDKKYMDYVELLRKHGAKTNISSETLNEIPAKSLLASAISKYVIPKENLKISEQMRSCAANLRKIYAAMKKYENDKGMLPYYLSDLVPDYVNKETLFCPHNPEGKAKWPYDPKFTCGYVYEFSPFRGISRFGGSPYDGMTNRDRKTAQMGLFGDVVPIVRCRHHDGPILNLALSGEIYTSDTMWEHLFMDYQVGSEFQH